MTKYIAAFAALLLVSTVGARSPITFEEAMDAYEAGSLAEARGAFRRLAETGFPEAQRQLGNMLLQGEGGPTDVVAGALWIHVAFPGEGDPAQIIARSGVDLTADQTSRLERAHRKWRARYALDAQRDRHAPVDCSEDCMEVPAGAPMRSRDSVESWLGDEPIRVHQRAPRYPNELRRRGIPGYVQLGAWVGADGHLRNPHVVFSDPEWIFDEPALTALELWRVEWLDGSPPSDERYITQTIYFSIDGRSWQRKARRQYERDIEDWNDDLSGAYRAARMAYSLGIESAVGGRAGMTELTHRAARAGLARAQIDLYEQLQYGIGVQGDSESALFWLKRAAFSGDALARFFLSQHEELEPELRQDLLIGAARAGAVPAVMTVLRQQLSAPGTADKSLLADLVEGLPEFWYMVNPDQSLVERARTLISG